MERRRRSVPVSPAAALVVALALGASPAAGAAITFALDTPFGDTSPSGVLTAVVDDAPLAGGVLLTFSALGLAGEGEKVKDWYLNFAAPLGVSVEDLRFEHVAGPAAEVEVEADGFKAGGQGRFDIRFEWPRGAHDPDGFRPGDEAVYAIRGPAGVAADGFLAVSFSEKKGEDSLALYSAAHILGIGPDAQDSAFVGAPSATSQNAVAIPATLVLLGSGLALVYGVRKVAVGA
ncbi:MAG: hypothetical protein Kow0092_35180 [Deferrisomatales bacterium]